jgi:hypothetical protein
MAVVATKKKNTHSKRAAGDVAVIVMAVVVVGAIHIVYL